MAHFTVPIEHHVTSVKQQSIRTPNQSCSTRKQNKKIKKDAPEFVNHFLYTTLWNFNSAKSSLLWEGCLLNKVDFVLFCAHTCHNLSVNDQLCKVLYSP